MEEEKDIEIESTDIENMQPKQREIYERRMRVFENRFMPHDRRLTHEQLADREKVTRDTIEKDIRWVKTKYPKLWHGDQVAHGFSYGMLKISKIYEIMIEEIVEQFQTTQNWNEKIKLAYVLNNLMPTYTNSKAHGAILKRVEETIEGGEDDEKAN